MFAPTSRVAKLLSQFEKRISCEVHTLHKYEPRARHRSYCNSTCGVDSLGKEMGAYHACWQM